MTRDGVTGDRLSGTILDLGADWRTVFADGSAELDTRYSIETHDGALIDIRNFGYRHGPTGVIEALARGENFDASRYYMRTQPRFETGDARYAWLDRTVFAGTGQRLANGARVTFFEVVMSELTTRRKSAAEKPKGGAEEVINAELPNMDNIIGYKLRRAQLHVFQDFISVFSKLRLRPAEFSVLTLIADKPGQKQTEIAGQLGIKRANFVALMDGLERRGLAERRKTMMDKRSHSLHLTPEGVRFVKKMMAIWNEHEGRLVERLGGPRERDRLIALLDRITDQPDKE